MNIITNMKLVTCYKILNAHMKNIIIFIIPIISHCFFFMHCRYIAEVNKVWSSRLFFLQFVLAWLFIGGLFQTAMVIMTHVN